MLVDKFYKQMGKYVSNYPRQKNLMVIGIGVACVL